MSLVYKSMQHNVGTGVSTMCIRANASLCTYKAWYTSVQWQMHVEHGIAMYQTQAHTIMYITPSPPQRV